MSGQKEQKSGNESKKKKKKKTIANILWSASMIEIQTWGREVDGATWAQY